MVLALKTMTHAVVLTDGEAGAVQKILVFISSALSAFKYLNH